MRKNNLLSLTKESLLEACQSNYMLVDCAPFITRLAELTITALKRGNKIILFGNGGSAADSQHIAAELIGRFTKDKRHPLPAIALTTNTSLITAIANDYGFDSVFSWQIQALAKKGDVAIAISTSGNSPNVLEAVKLCKKLHVKTIGLTGQDGGKLKDIVDFAFCAPSNTTARIQECHITVGHVICGLIEASF
ncbi:MAG: D-sedoheptulose 7-phosphate isomerase [Planctomycetes bacterium]|nr:D-sedoheptulose 7-phosphate isomerase [Planctomycetota bacterium]